MEVVSWGSEMSEFGSVKPCGTRGRRRGSPKTFPDEKGIATS